MIQVLKDSAGVHRERKSEKESPVQHFTRSDYKKYLLFVQQERDTS